MNKKFRDLRTLALILAAILIVIILAQLKIEYSINTYAKILPARQWIVMRGNDGMYMSSVQNLSSGINSSYAVNQFERGASVRVELNSNLKPNLEVKTGDTLGVIYSSTNLQVYTELEGQLKVAKAELEVSLSGEKESIISQAEQKLRLAESNADRQVKITARLKQMFEKNLGSEEEYQVAADELRSLNIEVDVRRAELESAKTGLKNSEIERIRSYIKSIENQLSVIEKQLEMFTITAPFEGRIERCLSSDTLLILSCTKNCLAVMPVGIDQTRYLLPDSRIIISNESREITASFLDLNHTAEIVNNKQCITLTALMAGEEPLVYGVILPAEIKGKKITFFEYLLVLFS